MNPNDFDLVQSCVSFNLRVYPQKGRRDESVYLANERNIFDDKC